MEKINCHYCGTKISDIQDTCHRCGGPNTPEPLPWHQTISLRVKASLMSKRESVWADRLASLMPLDFIIALASLAIAFFGRPEVFEVFSLNSLVIYFSIIALVAPLSLYPSWYSETPAQRQEYGTMYFIFRLVYWIIILSFFF